MHEAEGGGATADVVAESGSTPFLRKHLGPTRYEPITIAFGLGLAPPLYEWISASWSGKAVRKSGAIVAIGIDGRPVRVLEFENATIVETTLPALDATAKSACWITLTIAPRFTRTTRPSRTLKLPVPSQKQKAWLPANFRFELGDLPCGRVMAVAPLTVGGSPPVDFPNLKLTLSAADEQAWTGWHEEFVVQGLNDDAHEKKGRLVYLSPDRKDELGWITISQVGIFRLGRDEAQPGAGRSQPVERLVAELYCEEMTLEL